MIITCEQCHARYLLASLLLGSSGRKVRCGVCSHEWFQDQVDETYQKPTDHTAPTDGIDMSFGDHLEAEILEPIPESIQPIPEGSSVPAIKRDPLSFLTAKETRNGLVAAVVVVLLLALGLIVMRGPVVQMWGPSALAFQSIKVPVPITGEGLIFDRLSAKAVPDDAGHFTLQIEGNIINLKSENAVIPPVRATLRETPEITGDSWVIPLEQSTIGPEETIPFTATYPNLPDVIKDVNIRFVAE